MASVGMTLPKVVAHGPIHMLSAFSGQVLLQGK